MCSPLFVSWDRDSTTTGKTRLRGCLGTLEPRWIQTALKDYALRSALSDRRFSPIQWEEVPLLSCTVSLLRYFERADTWEDWDIGKHGLVVKFLDPVEKCQRTATFLPHIAAEQRWSKRETLEQLIKKAGYNRCISDELQDSIELTRYQSSTAIMSYNEYFQRKKMPLEYELSNGHANGMPNGSHFVGE